MADLSPELLTAAATQIAAVAAQEASESDYDEIRLLWAQEDALDSVLYDMTKEHFAAELQALSDREKELSDRQDAILEECRLAVELLIDNGVNLQRLPSSVDLKRALEDAHRLLNPPRGTVPDRSLGEVTELLDWSVPGVPGEAGDAGRVLDPRIKGQLFPQRQPTGHPNGRPAYGENRPDLIASRLRSGVDQRWTVEELRECVGRNGPTPRALQERRMALSLVVARMRDASGHDKCAVRGIAEALKCSTRAVERLAAEGREARVTQSVDLSVA